MFGKILVFLALGLSLVGLTWSIALYEHRVNWTDKPTKDGQPAMLPPLRNEFNAQAQTITPSYVLRLKARDDLSVHEYYLPQELKWYADEIQFILTGQYRGKAWPDRPIRQLNLDPNSGQPLFVAQVGPDGELLQMTPLMDGGDPKANPPVPPKPIADATGQPLKLQPLHKYWADYAAKVTQTGEQMTRLKTAGEDDQQATGLLIGREWDKTKRELKPAVKGTGLQERLEIELDRQKKLVEARNDLLGPLTNAKIELLNFIELRQRLDDRIKELEEAKRKRDTTSTPVGVN